MVAHEIGRTFLALGLVLGLLWLFAKLARARQGGKLGRPQSAGTSGRIDVVARRSLGRHCSVAVVKVGGRTVVLGQTPQQITVLTEIDEHGAAPLEVVSEPARPRTLGRLTTNRNDLMPRLAPGSGAEAPKAWDAIVDGLRELTVRR
ncbi:MAG: flagellar biosynthetic protein FliO [Acidimicrobiales bacterium]|jgi:flagellar biogenesis protein FliO